MVEESEGKSLGPSQPRREGCRCGRVASRGREKAYNILRPVLAISIHDDHTLSSAPVDEEAEANSDRSLVAEVSAEAHRAEIRNRSKRRPASLANFTRRSIVYDENACVQAVLRELSI